MDLIRLIKLKKLNGELDDLTEQEEFFFSLFNDLSINDNRYVKDNDTYFFLNLKTNILYCSYNKVISPFKNNFDVDVVEVKNSIDYILKDRLNLVNFVSSSYHFLTW